MLNSGRSGHAGDEMGGEIKNDALGHLHSLVMSYFIFKGQCLVQMGWIFLRWLVSSVFLRNTILVNSARLSF